MGCKCWLQHLPEIWRNGLHVLIGAQFCTGWIFWLLLYLIFIIWRNGLHVQIVAPAWMTNGCNNGISTNQSFRQVPQFWTGWILWLILYLIFIIWRNGLHVPIVAQFWTGLILWLLLYLIFTIWRNGLHVLINFHDWRNGLHAPQVWTGWILQLLLYLIFIICRNGLHALIVVPAWKTNGRNNGIGTHQSFKQVLQFWTSRILWLLLYLIFIIWRNGLHAPIAVPAWKDNCSACLKGRWVQQWDWCPSVFHAGAAILNMFHFMVTTVSNFHNFYPQECPLLASAPIIGRCTHHWQVHTWSAQPSLMDNLLICQPSPLAPCGMKYCQVRLAH